MIEGTVFRDWNQNGIQDAAVQGSLAEPGVAGIEVQAFDSAGAAAGPATTDADGHYSVDLAALSDALSSTFRVEFTIPPALSYLEPAPVPDPATTGTVRNGTSVQFSAATGGVSLGSAGVDFGVANPTDYCQPNPLVVTPCYIAGEMNGHLGALKTFDYDRTGPVTDIATQGEIGATWGVAWHRSARKVFEAAFTKRYATYQPGTGDDGPDQIFVTDPATSTSAVLVTIEAGTDMHDPAQDYDVDNSVWDAVGKTAFGDIDISADESLLYVVNLFDRGIYEVAPGSSPGPGTGSVVGGPISFPDPGTGADGCPVHPSTAGGELNRNLVPGGLKVHDGLLYVTLTCTAEDVGGQGNPVSFLRGFVYAFDGATFTQVANFPLNYARGCVIGTLPSCARADWRAWTPTIVGSFAYPQPWLTDIEIDDRGFMIVGIVDRFGHQAGASFTGAGNTAGITAGDILRLAPAGATWTLENNATAGTTTTAGAGNNQGPGGGEFYFQDDLANVHDEVSIGGLAHKTAADEVLSTVFDPVTVNSGGVHYYDNTTGGRTGAVQLFANSAPQTFGKTAGLGDLELLCDAAPVQIGNRVWLDLDGDGVQGPEEAPVPNVTVDLLDAGGAVVGTATTGGGGDYAFSIDPHAAYTVRFDTSTVTAADLPSGYPATGLVFTTPDSGTNDAVDSDAITVTPASATVAVGPHGPGENDHSFDAGILAGRMRLGNLVWSDLNDDGVAGAGEPGISGVTVELYADTDTDGVFDTANDVVAASTTTSAGGAYFFTDLVDGTYFVAIPGGQPVLAATRSSTGIFAGSTDNDDNGEPAGSFDSVSGPITMQLGVPLPTGETDANGGDDEAAANAVSGHYPDTASDLTIDFGFFEPTVPGEKPKDDKKEKVPDDHPVVPLAKQDHPKVSQGKLSKSGTEVDDKLVLGTGLIGAGLTLLLVARVRKRRWASPPSTG